MPSPVARFRVAALVLSVTLGLVAGLPAVASAGAAPSTAPASDPAAKGDDTVHPEVARKLQGRDKHARVSVIVSLDVPRAETGPRPSDIRSARSAVVGSLPAGSYQVRARYDRLPAVSMVVSDRALAALSRHPRVTAVNADHEVELSDTEAHALTGVDDVLATGEDGAGATVAVIDSGVDVTGGVVHPGLADDLLGQACFRTENDCPGGAGSAQDQNGHGTHVSGIITGPDGVAPAAKFHALKVFTTGSTSDTNILNALNHVIGLNTATPGAVDLVNMSLGGGKFASGSACDAANVAYVNAFASLNAQGTAIFVATGNDAWTDGVGSPSCVTGAIGVGSVGDGVHSIGFSSCTDVGAVDKVTCFSNATPVQGEGELVDLLAPGCQITSLWLAGGTNTICGTSMATPYAAGVAALVLGPIKDAGSSITPAELETLLEDSGQPVSDYRLVDGPDYPRVYAPAAVGSRTLEPPTGVHVVASTATSVTIGWQAHPTATEYDVYRAVGDGPSELVGSTTTLQLTDTPVACGDLTYRVRASDGTFTSLPSAPLGASARACPQAVVDLTLTPSGAMSHELEWTDTNPDETSVILQRRRTGQQFADLQTFGPGSSFAHPETLTTCGLVAYRVVVERDGDLSSPSDVVSRSMCAPDNDHLADAEAVAAGELGTSVTDTEPQVRYATSEPTDPQFSCRFGGAGPGHHSIWYRITPETDTAVRVSTDGSTQVVPASSDRPDTLLAVYRGTPSAVSEVACNDDISGSNLRSRLMVGLKAGSTYFVQVAQWGEVPEDPAGNVITAFGWVEPPVANDQWEDAEPIGPTPYQHTVADAQRSGVSGSDPAHPCRSGGASAGSHTLWWSFTPQFDGTLDLDTETSSGSFADTVLSVWTGSPGGFTHVACNDDIGSPNLRSRLVGVPVTAGTTYSVLVSRWNTSPTETPGTVALAAAYAATPAVVVSPTEVTVREGGATDGYDVRLTTQPTADVVVAATGDDDCEVEPTSLTFTEETWEEPQSVTVTAVDDGVGEGTHECTITHTATSDDPDYDGAATPDVVGTVTERPLVVGRPDGRIKKIPGPLVGDNVYGGVARQTVAAKVRRGRPVTFGISVQNDAEVAERLRVKGGRTSNRFTVTYRNQAGANVTKQVVGGRFRTPVLAAGKAYLLRVVVKPKRTAPKGASLKRPVTVFSTEDPTRKDTVAFQVRRR